MAKKTVVPPPDVDPTPPDVDPDEPASAQTISAPPDVDPPHATPPDVDPQPGSYNPQADKSGSQIKAGEIPRDPVSWLGGIDPLADTANLLEPAANKLKPAFETLSGMGRYVRTAMLPPKEIPGMLDQSLSQKWDDFKAHPGAWAYQGLSALMNPVTAPLTVAMSNQQFRNAEQNSRPEWLGGTPEKAPAGREVAEALGWKDTARDASVYDDQGNIKWAGTTAKDADWRPHVSDLASPAGILTAGVGGYISRQLQDRSEMAAHVGDFAKNMAVDIATDPVQIALLFLHPGASAEEAAAATARMEAFATNSVGKAELVHGLATKIYEGAELATKGGGDVGEWASKVRPGDVPADVPSAVESAAAKQPKFGVDSGPSASGGEEIAAANKYVNRPWGDLVRDGQMGLRIKGPFGTTGDLGFMPFPKVTAPIFDALEASGLTKGVPGFAGQSGPIYEAFREAKNKVRAEVKGFIAEKVAPIFEEAEANGATPKNYEHAANLMEASVIDPATLEIRLPAELEPLAQRAGIAAAKTVNPTLVAEPLARVAKLLPRAETLAQAAETAKQGWQVYGDTLQDTLEEMTEHSPAERAVTYNIWRRLLDLPDQLREFQNSRGMSVPKLGAAKLARPGQIADMVEQSVKDQVTAEKGVPARTTSYAKLQEMVKNGKDLNFAEHEILQNKAAEEMIQAAKETEAVPTYRPGYLTPEMKAGTPFRNVNVQRPRGLTSVEDSFRNRFLDSKKYGVNDVPASVKSGELEIARGGTGTKGTQGVLPGADPQTFTAAQRLGRGWNWFFENMFKGKAIDANRELFAKTGGGDTFFQSNAVKAFMDQLTGPVTNDLTLLEIQRNAMKNFDMPVAKAWDMAKAEAYANPSATLPELQKIWENGGGEGAIEGKFHPNVAEGLRNGTIKVQDAFKPSASPYLRGIAPVLMPDEPFEAALKYARETEQPSAAGFQAAYKSAGGVGDVLTKIPNQIRDAMLESAMPTAEDAAAKLMIDPKKWAGMTEFFKYGRAATEPTFEGAQAAYEAGGGTGSVMSKAHELLKEIGEDHFDMVKERLAGLDAPKEARWVHHQVGSQLEVMQKLGTDPYAFTRFLGQAAPLYKTILDKWKAWQTAGGPGVFGHVIRKQAHDSARMVWGEGVDGLTAGDIGRTVDPYAQFVKSGSTDFSVFKDLKYDLGNGPIDGDIAMREFVRQGGDHGSATADLYGDMEALKNDEGAMARFKQLEAGRDNANRSAFYFARRRAGDTPFAAGMKLNEVMFDQSNLGPVVQFLRNTGVAPFSAWHSKVIPYMMRMAIENPGEFLAIQKIGAELQAGNIDPEQLPESAKDRFGLTIKPHKNDKGETVVELYTDSGTFVPFSEVTHFASAFKSPAHFEAWAKENLGPLPKLMMQAEIERRDEERDPSKKSWWDTSKRLATTAIGRPARTAEDILNIGAMDEHTREKGTVSDVVQNALLPILHQKVVVDPGRDVHWAKREYDSRVKAEAIARADLAKETANRDTRQVDLNKLNLAPGTPFDLPNIQAAAALRQASARTEEAKRLYLQAVERSKAAAKMEKVLGKVK